MNKLELIQTVKDRTGLSKQEAINLVKLFFDSLTETMINGERIEIRGFCSFFIKEYAGYTGRNPKTGGKIKHWGGNPHRILRKILNLLCFV